MHTELQMSKELGYFFETLVVDVGTWSGEQFGDQPSTYPLLGSGEELGELLTSILKRLQGIDDAEKYERRGTVGDDAEQDAVADVIIYLADYAYRQNILTDPLLFERLDTIVDETDDVAEASLGVMAHVGALADYQRSPHHPAHNPEHSLAMVIGYLNEICEHRGFDLLACLKETAEEVLEREWDASILERDEQLQNRTRTDVTDESA